MAAEPLHRRGEQQEEPGADEERDGEGQAQDRRAGRQDRPPAEDHLQGQGSPHQS